MDRPVVSISRCPGYDADLRPVLDSVLLELGGMCAFAKPGQSVLVKPNLLTDRVPGEAVTTHPEVVRAILHSLKDLGALPFVADSPSNVVKIERVWEKTGFAAMCTEEGVPLVSLEKSGADDFNCGGFTFTISKTVREADVIINVPKVKTHILTTLTGAVKNMYGTVPGFHKLYLHKNHPDLPSFGRVVSNICRVVKPTLSIADGVVGMQGNGPSAGDPLHLGFLAASADPFALDIGLCRILGVDPQAVSYLRAAKDDLGDDWPSDVEFVGVPPDDVAPATFRLPGVWRLRLIPRWLFMLLRPFVWLRPCFSSACVACGRCVKACPVQALSLAEGESRPRLDAPKCIECCCCHEICPERAISMGQSPLMNLVRRGRLP